MRLLSHPFRLTPGGQAATVEQGTDDANIEQVAILAMTRAGERPMAPGFGMTDPAFVGFRASELVAGVKEWGPPVHIGDVEVANVDDGTQRVTVELS